MTQMTQDRKYPRRTVLKSSWDWIRYFAYAVLAYPVLRFVSETVPRKPRKVKIDRTLLPGGYLLAADFVLFSTPSGPVAVSRICTHLGCHLDFSQAANLLICPCHQSKFTIHGIRVAGPARRNLPVYKVEQLSGKKGGYIVTL